MNLAEQYTGVVRPPTFIRIRHGVVWLICKCFPSICRQNFIAGAAQGLDVALQHIRTFYLGREGELLHPSSLFEEHGYVLHEDYVQGWVDGCMDFCGLVATGGAKPHISGIEDDTLIQAVRGEILGLAYSWSPGFHEYRDGRRHAFEVMKLALAAHRPIDLHQKVRASLYPILERIESERAE